MLQVMPVPTILVLLNKNIKIHTVTIPIYLAARMLKNKILTSLHKYKYKWFNLKLIVLITRLSKI
jgi:hypothetical protein